MLFKNSHDTIDDELEILSAMLLEKDFSEYHESDNQVILTNFARKYRKAFVRGVGAYDRLSSAPVAASLALPPWKSNKAHSTWKQ